MLAQETNDKGSNKLQDIVNEAEDFMKSTSDHLSDRAKEIRARLETALESAKAASRKMQEKAVEAAKATDHSIREHPYESIGVAFGVGLLLGVLLGRRR